MQCFICVTYMIFFCAAHPGKDREVSTQHVRRSLFHDVIESLRIRSQLPEDFTNNEENNINQYERYGYENEQQLPSDSGFVPRRNDRIEMPSLKYRFPKSLSDNFSVEQTTDSPKEEIILYIDTTKEPKPSTQKPKKQKRPNPQRNKNKTQNKVRDEEVTDESENLKPEDYPLINSMQGQSQIGNRESQMVVKPTVIVNIRGTVTHRDSDIRVEGRLNNETTSRSIPHNVFNIKQEIKLDRTYEGMGSHGGHKKTPGMVDSVKVVEKASSKSDEDMMMCETATWDSEKNRESRKYDNVLQILFSLQGK